MKKKRLNKTNCLNDAGKTIDVNKINKLYNLINLNNKGSLSGKNIEKHRKINFREKFSQFGTPLGSPKNANKGNLQLKREFSGEGTNKLMQFYLPNLQNGGTLSPTFAHGFKLKGKLNINLAHLNNQLKLKLNKQNKKQNIGLNYKKLMNNNNTNKPIGFKRSSSTSMFNQFMNNNNINKGFSSKRNRNPSENKNNFGDSGSQFYLNKKGKTMHHNSSAINC